MAHNRSDFCQKYYMTKYAYRLVKNQIRGFYIQNTYQHVNNIDIFDAENITG